LPWEISGQMNGSPNDAIASRSSNYEFHASHPKLIDAGEPSRFSSVFR
jgi:hypothetical protein